MFNLRILILFFVSAFCCLALHAEKTYCFRVYLNDNSRTYQPNRLGEVLSEEAIEKKAKRMIATDALDFPLSASYIESLLAANCQLVTSSKWLSTVVVEATDSLIVEELKAFNFVDSVHCVWYGYDRLKGNGCPKEIEIHEAVTLNPSKPYGNAEEQIKMLNGLQMHESGYQGQGMRIAVIDAGFLNVNRIPAFESLKLIDTRNFVIPSESVFCGDEHGTRVLSCLAANYPGYMIGSAPEASYLLIKTEDTRSEFPIEEDYWAAAAEYADSVGVDIISSSLGYYIFDSNEEPYTQNDLNGKTAFITKAAEIAANKGILLFSSAGNEGSSSWGKITFPADAADAVTVGAITSDKKIAGFSSVGLTSDYRIKPDLVALGEPACVIGSDGQTLFANGTSFATPTVAGLGACLWQALHWLTSKEVADLLKRSSNLHKRPDAEYGYGVPNIYQAYKMELNGSVQ